MTAQTLPTINSEISFEQIATVIGQHEVQNTPNAGLSFLRIN